MISPVEVERIHEILIDKLAGLQGLGTWEVWNPQSIDRIRPLIKRNSILIPFTKQQLFLKV